VGKALDGLKGISEHTFDNETWVFTVTYNSRKLKIMTIIDAVEAAEDGFKVKNWKQVNSEQGEVK